MPNINLRQISKLLDEKLAPIEKTLEGHGRKLDEHGKMLKSHGSLLRSLKKDQDTMLDMLDREQMGQRKRLDRIERHLDLPAAA